MEDQLIIDNWMLQDINQAFEQGLSPEEGGEMVIDIKIDIKKDYLSELNRPSGL